jgi:hypothetical protein
MKTMERTEGQALQPGSNKTSCCHEILLKSMQMPNAKGNEIFIFLCMISCS